MEGQRYRFPTTFYWGSATSAYQVEGGIENDWSLWERSPERIAQLKRQGENPAAFVSGKATDFWNRYEEDLDNAHLLGHTMFRISIEWSRIEPQEGQFDNDALAHYRKIVDAIRVRGMEPMVTLWHFTNPQWFAERGGFLSKDATQVFTRYAVRVARALRNEVRYWVTFNEATTVYAWMTYGNGMWLGERDGIKRFLAFRKVIASTHERVYREMKRMCGERCQIGSVENNRAVLAGPWLGAGTLIQRMYSHWLWRRTKNDFLGLNYYTTRRLPLSGKSGPVAREMNWEIWPSGLYGVLTALKGFQKPIFVTENGIADAGDTMRSSFIREHISWMAKAMSEGIDVRGYLHWSLTDNFEWGEGSRPRFGLVAIDYETQKRTIRPSAYAYAKIISEHVVDLPGSRRSDSDRDSGRRR